ncbi:MAG: FAD-dependent oxidoreductase [Anaeromyxobacteraceae bacterium]
MSAARPSRRRLAADVCVVGAGPAGVAAACRAAEGGRKVAVLDEGFGPGGQIWRHAPAGAPPAEARPWLERLSRSGAEVLRHAALFEARCAGDGFRLSAEHREGGGPVRLDVDARAVVLATGARELLLPFPGWTLPGVAGAGGLQALVKGGLEVRGKRIVLGGTGPLLLAAAEALEHAGAEVVAVAEQAGTAALAGLGLRLLGKPGKLGQALRLGRTLGSRLRAGTWIVRAEGTGGVEAVVLTDGRREERLACELLGVSFGLVPSAEAARLLGAAASGGAVAVNDHQETSVPGLFAAGELCGVAGVEVALAEGQLAGLAAAGLPPEPAPVAERRTGRDFARAMDRAYALRPELLRPLAPDLVVCRCEDVRAGELDAAGATSAREAKLATRTGMGPCQGRVCGAALERLRGLEPATPRSPIVPVALSTLLEE